VFVVKFPDPVKKGARNGKKEDPDVSVFACPRKMLVTPKGTNLSQDPRSVPDDFHDREEQDQEQGQEEEEEEQEEQEEQGSEPPQEGEGEQGQQMPGLVTVVRKGSCCEACVQHPDFLVEAHNKVRQAAEAPALNASAFETAKARERSLKSSWKDRKKGVRLEAVGAAVIRVPAAAEGENFAEKLKEVLPSMEEVDVICRSRRARGACGSVKSGMRVSADHAEVRLLMELKKKVEQEQAKGERETEEGTRLVLVSRVLADPRMTRARMIVRLTLVLPRQLTTLPPCPACAERIADWVNEDQEKFPPRWKLGGVVFGFGPGVALDGLEQLRNLKDFAVLHDAGMGAGLARSVARQLIEEGKGERGFSLSPAKGPPRMATRGEGWARLILPLLYRESAEWLPNTDCLWLQSAALRLYGEANLSMLATWWWEDPTRLRTGARSLHVVPEAFPSFDWRDVEGRKLERPCRLYNKGGEWHLKPLPFVLPPTTDERAQVTPAADETKKRRKMQREEEKRAKKEIRRLLTSKAQENPFVVLPVEPLDEDEEKDLEYHCRNFREKTKVPTKNVLNGGRSGEWRKGLTPPPPPRAEDVRGQVPGDPRKEEKKGTIQYLWEEQRAFGGGGGGGEQGRETHSHIAGQAP
jgi:hypothetical protein